MHPHGIKELIVIAQDTTKYGIDIYGESRLAELLDKLCKIEGFKWIRFLYSYPETITDELINSNIIYRVDNYKEVQIVPKNSTVAMNITFYYSSDVQADDITQIATLNYKFERPYASHLEFDHTNVDTTCTNVQCALDELYERF